MFYLNVFLFWCIFFFPLFQPLSFQILVEIPQNSGQLDREDVPEIETKILQSEKVKWCLGFSTKSTSSGGYRTILPNFVQFPTIIFSNTAIISMFFCALFICCSAQKQQSWFLGVNTKMHEILEKNCLAWHWYLRQGWVIFKHNFVLKLGDWDSIF